MSTRTRALLGVAAFAAALTGLVGFAHTPAGRPILGYLGRMTGAGDGCPVPMGRKLPPAEREAVRRRAVEAATPAASGAAPARSLAIHGFTLGTSRRADVAAFVARTRAVCDDRASPGFVCDAIPPDGLPPELRSACRVSHFAAAFDEQERLVTLALHRSCPDAKETFAVWQAARDAASASFGPPSDERGDATTAFLEQEIAQVAATYRFTDVRAFIYGNHMGRLGFTTNEHYDWVPAKGPQAAPAASSR